LRAATLFGQVEVVASTSHFRHTGTILTGSQILSISAMVFAPLTSDAPLYHWPRATVGLIVANVLAFVVVRSGLAGSEQEVLKNVGLLLGEGHLHPLQWITSNFLHPTFLHLAGNMLFLWAFGLIVEGKVGWKWFLAIYLAAGVLESAGEQVCLYALNETVVSYGASAVVFSLMAIALVWAPRNDLVIGYWLPVLNIGTADVSVVTFALLFLAAQVVLALVGWLLAGMALSSQMLHLSGAVIGFAIGTVMLRRSRVDCEGWDLFSVLRGRHIKAASDMYITSLKDSTELAALGASTSAEGRRKGGDEKRGAARRKARCINRVRSLLDRDRPLDALSELREVQHVLPDWRLPARDHLRLAEALQQQACWNEAVALWEEYLRNHPDAPVDLRLRAALTMLDHQRRPQAALNVLAEASDDALSSQERALIEDINRRAGKLLDAGVIELDVRRS
jgi:membrane associated rhomboid family serine protease